MWFVKNCQAFYEIERMLKRLILAKNIWKQQIEVILDGIGTLWLNEKHTEEKLGHKHLPVITNKYDPVYKKHRYELDRETTKRGKQNIFS